MTVDHMDSVGFQARERRNDMFEEWSAGEVQQHFGLL